MAALSSNIQTLRQRNKELEEAVQAATAARFVPRCACPLVARSHLTRCGCGAANARGEAESQLRAAQSDAEAVEARHAQAIEEAVAAARQEFAEKLAKADTAATVATTKAITAEARVTELRQSVHKHQVRPQPVVPRTRARAYSCVPLARMR